MDSAIPLPPEIDEPVSKSKEQDLGLNSELLREHERNLLQLPREPSIQDMLTLRQSPLVEDAFLALFALDEPQSNELAISGRLGKNTLLELYPPSLYYLLIFNAAGIATKNLRPDPTPFTSELDTLQQDMRQR